MVRRYVRKTDRQNWLEQNMIFALTNTLEGRISSCKASKVYKISRNTLRRRLKLIENGYLTIEQACSKLMGAPKVLSDRQEQLLVDHILLLESRLFNMKFRDIKCLAYELAEFNTINKFNKVKKMAGEKWLADFLSRHPVLPVQKFKTLYNDSSNVDRKLFNKFFDVIDLLCKKHNILPDNIYGLDEFGITALPDGTSEVITKSTKIEVLSQLDKPGVMISSICCTCAAGTFMPPSFVFPLDIEDSSLLKEVQKGSISDFHLSGRIQPAMFGKWLEKFVEFSKPTHIKPVLLVLDGNSRHAKSFEFVNKARQNNVHLLSFPLNSVDFMNPLGCFLDNLSAFYKDEVSLWTDDHPEESITLREITKLFVTAFSEAAVAKVANEGFRKTGLVPLNRTVFPEDMFEPSTSDERVSGVEEQSPDVEPSELLPEITWYTETPIVIKDNPLPLRSSFMLSNRKKVKQSKTFNLSRWRNKMKKGLKEVVSTTNEQDCFQNMARSDVIGSSLVALEEDCSSKTIAEVVEDEKKFACLNPEEVLISDIIPKEEPMDDEYTDNTFEAEAVEINFEDLRNTTNLRNLHCPLESSLNEIQLFNDKASFEEIKVEVNDQEQAVEIKVEEVEDDFVQNYVLSNQMGQGVEPSSNHNMFNTADDANNACYNEQQRASLVQPRQMLKCSKCDREFQWKRHLTLHQMTMHKEIMNKKRQVVSSTKNNSQSTLVEGCNGKSIAVTHVSSSNLPVVLAIKPTNQAPHTDSDDKDVFFTVLKGMLRTIPEVHRQATKQKIMQLVYNITTKNMDPSTISFVTEMYP